MSALPNISAALDDTFRAAPELGELIAIDDDTWVALMPSGGEVMVTWVAARENLLLPNHLGRRQRRHCDNGNGRPDGEKPSRSIRRFDG